MEPLLEIKNLVKRFGGFTAVDGVSFAVEQGLCFGLLGPNGAGKTTTIEMIEGVISPTAGDIFYMGSPLSSTFKEEIGIQFQETSLLSFLSVRETLKTFKAFYQNTEKIDRLLDLCHLEDIQHQYNDKISGGQKQRLMLALALVNRPRLLFLDEPSTGLDPQARLDLWRVVESIKDDGKTIILTTHYMEEAQHLCDDIAIMDLGQIIARGSPGALIKTHCPGESIILAKGSIPFPLHELPFSVGETRDALEIRAENINETLDHLLSRNVDLSEMVIRSPNLENVFLNLTGRKLRD